MTNLEVTPSVLEAINFLTSNDFVVNNESILKRISEVEYQNADFDIMDFIENEESTCTNFNYKPSLLCTTKRAEFLMNGYKGYKAELKKWSAKVYKKNTTILSTVYTDVYDSEVENKVSNTIEAINNTRKSRKIESLKAKVSEFLTAIRDENVHYHLSL